MDSKYLIPVSEAAKKFNLGRDGIYALIKSQADFPFLKVGNKFLINVPMLESWIDKATLEGIHL